jgi:hypothetical protein
MGSLLIILYGGEVLAVEKVHSKSSPDVNTKVISENVQAVAVNGLLKKFFHGKMALEKLRSGGP